VKSTELNDYNHIKEKLQKFIKKFYINELIKGLLLFFSIGLLYFIFTLFLEYFLWLKPVYRSVLFWLFILVELGLLINYILIPIFKIYGFKRGISEEQASKIIGDYFPDVSDKLLNMLQLGNLNQHSELIEASIEQRSKELQLIPFKRAINFSTNKKYLKYALLPIIIISLVYFTGNTSSFNKSFKRVVHYKTTYKQPAPFQFQIVNKSLTVVEGSPLKIDLKIVGNSIPNEVTISFLNQNYYLINKGFGKFEYTFSKINNPINFNFEANGFTSKTYKINSLDKPSIIDMKMVVSYPSYTNKKNEVISNTGNAIVPEGTKISWQINTQKTDTVNFFENDKKFSFNQNSTDYFSFNMQIITDLAYKIAVSNQQLTNYESLNYAIQVIKDEFPKISVESDIDSISRGPVQFAGQVSDDYSVTKLQLVYYTSDKPKIHHKTLINITKSGISDFYYVFPTSENLVAGKNYNIYFEVFDNDAVNGSKKTKSKLFSYYVKTKNEVNKEVIEEQKNNIQSLSNTLENNKKTANEMDKLKQEIENKPNINWEDTKLLQQFLNRQNNYLNQFLKQTNTIDKNLKEEVTTKSNKEKKEDLQKRIEEAKQLIKQEKTLNELNKWTKKLQKEDLLKKLEMLAQKSKRNKQSLERLLELTKRFYVEQKANQISEKLKQLSEEQNKLTSKKLNDSSVTKQQQIVKDFNKIEEDLKDLHQQNNQLNRPMRLTEYKEKASEINKNTKNAVNQLKNKDSNATKSQKSAAKKMKELSDKMQTSINAMETEQIDENIEDLRKIVDNLLEFSFMQENLYKASSVIDNKHPDYPKNLKKQQTLKEYFEHIDDSLYVLSLRMVKMSSTIQKEVSNTHFYLNQSLSDFSDNLFDAGISDQRFVITSVNNLANLLSNLLEDLMNASPSFGKGKSGSPEFSLPDIIKKQGDLIKKLDGNKDGKKQGEKGTKSKNGENGEQNEQGNSKLYEIYKQQAFLREMLSQLINNNKSKSGNGNNASKKMEELEQEMLRNGVTKNAIQKMKDIKQELLKFEDALKEQGEDSKRNSKTGNQNLLQQNVKNLIFKKEYFNNNEILNRQSLPLRTIYKKKVNEYFKTHN
jgi:hypothetical protein